MGGVRLLQGVALQAGGHTSRQRRSQETFEKDTRDKSTMFPINQLEQARLWLVAYLNSAMEQPTRKFKLDTKKYPAASIITDASPEGVAAILLVNNKVIRALKSPVLLSDAEQLKFPFGESASQGVVETLAVLVAIKHWSKELATCNVTLHVQSDSWH